MMDAELKVGEVLRSYPSLVSLFIKKKIRCPGCPFENLHSLRDVANYHFMSESDLIEMIENHLKKTRKGG